MPSGGDKSPLSDRIWYGFTAVTDWAGRNNAATAGNDEPRPKRGCGHPFTIIKTLLLLLLIVLFPVFLMPMLLVRMSKLSWTGLKYGANVDIVTGDAARWGHGALQPIPEPGLINFGAATIARRDPGFRPRALTDWAYTATTLICQSLVSGDATCTRTFMSNGEYRAHQALLELRSRANVSFQGSWRAVDAYIVGATCSPLVEEIRVRVTCHGWRQERHERTGTTLRGGPEVGTWAEDLTFARSTRAITPPAGGLAANRCPSCGARLDLDQAGACKFCKGIVTAGSHDWVLVSWQREPW